MASSPTLDSDFGGEITLFEVNGEMASVSWFRQGDVEVNGKFVERIDYYNDESPAYSDCSELPVNRGMSSKNLLHFSSTALREIALKTSVCNCTQSEVAHSIAVFSHSLRQGHVFTTFAKGAEHLCCFNRSLRLFVKPTL